jgi:glucan biosynthesis protein
LSKPNIKSGFKEIGIWPLTSMAMDGKTKPNDVYIITPNIYNSNEVIWNLDGLVNYNP